MNGNPYRPEILGAFLASAVVLPLETWRRWGELASPMALDDLLMCGCAMVVAVQLARRDPAAPARWAFVCGGVWMLMCLSVWGSVYAWNEGDPSGAPVGAVLAFKGLGLVLVSVASWRALRRVRLADPYEG